MGRKRDDYSAMDGIMRACFKYTPNNVSVVTGALINEALGEEVYDPTKAYVVSKHGIRELDAPE